MTQQRKALQEDKQDICILFALFGVIFFYSLFVLWPYNVQPKILSDEIGNLANAAYFAGYNWAQSLSYTDFYSFGYGLLNFWFFRAFSNPFDIYRGMLVLNFLVMAASIFPIFGLLKRISPEMPRYLKFLIAFTITLYPPATSLAHFAFGESFLVFLFLCAFFIITIMSDNQFHPFASIALPVILILSLMLHVRSFALIIGVVFVLAWMLFKRKIDKKNVFIFLSVIACSFIGYLFLYTKVKNDLWYITLGSESENVNGFSYRLAQLLDSIKYYKNIVKSLFGHTIYLIISSLGVSLIGFLSAAYKALQLFRNRKAKKEESISYAAVAGVITFLVLLGISIVSLSVNASYPERLDRVFYGRYTDVVIPLFLVFASAWLYRCNLTRWRVILPFYGVTAAAALFGAAKIAPLLVNQPFQPVTVTGSYILLSLLNGVKSRENITIDLFPAILIVLVLSAIIILLAKYKKLVVAIPILLIFFLANSLLFAIYGVTGYTANDYQIPVRVQAFLDKEYQEIYCLKQFENSKYELNICNYFQFLDYKERYIFIYPDEIPALPIGSGFISRTIFNGTDKIWNQVFYPVKQLYLNEVIGETEDGSEEVILDLSSMMLENASFDPLIGLQIDSAIEETIISSLPIPMAAGSYEMVITYEVSEDFAASDVTNAVFQIYQYEVETITTDIETGTSGVKTSVIPFTVQQDTRALAYAFRAIGDGDLTVTAIHFKKMP